MGYTVVQSSIRGGREFIGKSAVLPHVDVEIPFSLFLAIYNTENSLHSIC